jgi:myo-inositol catabolism protein IolC
MQNGYQEALYFLPFDHRNSYVSSMFHFSLPLNAQQQEQVEDSKRVIYEGFLQAVEDGVSKLSAGILVDEEFGSQILRDARERGFITALSVEASGGEEFQFEYGVHFAEHIEQFDPTFVKVLVRYNPDHDPAMNQRQAERLKQLSDYCREADRMLMFELLVPPTDTQLSSVHGDHDAYDLHLRAQLMVRAITELQERGVEPAVWKIEGLDRREDCQSVVEAACRAGRDHVSCIVLGRGADESKVVAWLETAAAVDGFVGFAVGRSSFFEAVADYVAKKATREQAVQRIAQKFITWSKTFETAHESALRTPLITENLDFPA